MILGDVVSFIETHTQKVFQGTIVVEPRPSRGRVILGWKKTEDMPIGLCWKLDHAGLSLIHAFVAVPNLKDYEYGVWWDESELTLISSGVPIRQSMKPSVAKSNGIACCKCRDFYPFGEANQPNGTLICYSCRTTPFYGSIIS